MNKRLSSAEAASRLPALQIRPCKCAKDAGCVSMTDWLSWRYNSRTILAPS